MRKDDGVDGDAQRIGQLTWMMFLKIFDMRETIRAEQNSNYQPVLETQYRWKSWATHQLETWKALGKKEDAQRNELANELIRFVNQDLFPALEALPDDNNPQVEVIRNVFKDSSGNFMKSGTLMLGVIEKLEESINFDDIKAQGQLGDIYEKILNDLRSAGNAGEFYTPRALTEFMADRIKPDLSKNETVLDPACGTGGFLTAAIDQIREQLPAGSASESVNKQIAPLIFGFEKKRLPHLLCTTNMVLHGVDVPNRIRLKNSLKEAWGSWDDKPKYDCILSNPPFGGAEGDDAGTDYPIITKETADMFMQLIVKLLADNGRAAVILPDGFLFGKDTKSRIKETFLKECNLHTIVRLPKGVFSPYTTITSNMLFFTKGKPTKTIWYYQHQYPKGYKSYSKTKPIRSEEFEAEKALWGTEGNGFTDRQESETIWTYDFGAAKQKALVEAQPHWGKAERLEAEAKQLEQQELKPLRAKLRSAKKQKLPTVKELKQQILYKEEQIAEIFQQTEDAKAAGERIYWLIYDLDKSNYNAPEAKEYDPDELLVEYKDLLSEIEATQNELRDELQATLLPYIESEHA